MTTAEQATNAKLHNHNTTVQQTSSSEQLWHTVRLHKDTMSKLHRLGRFKESYSEVVDRIASEALGLSVSPEEGSF